MTMPNAFLIFLIAFSGVTGWLVLRHPAQVSQENAPLTPREQISPPKIKEDITESTKSQHLAQTRLDNIVLPIIDLENTNLEEAIEFLRLRALELAPENDEPQPSLDFVINTGADHSENRMINFYAEEITLTLALDRICLQAECKWEITGLTINIFPLKMEN